MKELAVLNLGILCKNSGRINEALEHYEQALEFEPEDPQIYSNIGNLYRDTGNLDQALQFTLKSLDLDHEINCPDESRQYLQRPRKNRRSANSHHQGH